MNLLVVFILLWSVAVLGFILFQLSKRFISAGVQKSASYILTIFFIFLVYFPLVFIIFVLLEKTSILSGECEGWCEDFAKIVGIIIGLVIPFGLFRVLQPRVYEKLKQLSKTKKQKNI